jgi:hypothetical protein
MEQEMELLMILQYLMALEFLLDGVMEFLQETKSFGWQFLDLLETVMNILIGQ